MLGGYRIAVVEDDEFMGGSLVQRLELEGAEVVWLRQISRAVGALRTPPKPVDAVVCDIRLPDGTGEDLFNRLIETTIPPPFLFVTGHGGIDQAVRLMRAGAADYVTKPFDIAVLLERLATLLARTSPDEFPSVLGISPAARNIDVTAAEAARLDRSVLIVGGPGTGKGLVARRIHEQSERRAAPFVTVNLAREAEASAALLLGGEALDAVGEGTLYIHAIERMTPVALSGLMATLSHGFSGRVIASSTNDLSMLLADAAGMAELIYRLDVLEIPIPALSDRPEDAVWLMSRLFPPMNARRPQPLERIGALSEDAVRTHSWPGGGRELRARLSRGVAVAPGPVLQPADLFPERTAETAGVRTLAEARDAAERQHIIEALERCDGQVGQAARLLNVSRTTLWDKMNKLDIRRADQ